MAKLLVEYSARLAIWWPLGWQELPACAEDTICERSEAPAKWVSVGWYPGCRAR
jgi:hypothetical protein